MAGLPPRPPGTRGLRREEGRFTALASLTFYFLLNGHKRCHFPIQNLAPSNRSSKWPISSAHPQAAKEMNQRKGVSRDLFPFFPPLPGVKHPSLR